MEGRKMLTRVLRVNDENLNTVAWEAAELIKKGLPVAVPTETVYGLAANALSENAVSEIYKAKGRPSDNPLIVHITDISDVDKLCREVPDSFYKLAEKFWPGPLTVVLKKSDCVPSKVTGGLDTVAIRMPSHPVIQEIIRLSCLPLAAPSANLSGKPSPTKAVHCANDLFGAIPLIVDGGDCEIGLESTVLSLAGEKAKLLRPGAVTVEQLSEIIGEIVVDKAVLVKHNENEAPEAPGMKYRHYAPKSPMQMVAGESKSAIEYINSKLSNYKKPAVLCFEEEKEFFDCKTISIGEKDDYKGHARRLFSALREFDTAAYDIIFARVISKDKEGLAFYNRLLKASGHNIAEV